MVVLLIAHHVNHLVDGVILEAHFSSTDILCHIDTGAIGTQQEFLIKALVSKIGPNRIVGMTLKETFGKSFLYFGFTLEIGLRFIVNLIERNTHLFVGLVETGIYPVVHLLPEGTNFGIIILPLHQHLVCLLNERSLLLSLFFVHATFNKLLYFFAIMLIEGNIVITNQVIALLAACLRSFAIAIFQPSQHRLTDMYASVVDNIGLHYTITVSLHNLCQRPAQQVVAHVS